MNFDKYKPFLIDYLNKCGCNIQHGVNRCFNPNHDDHNPSCEVFDDHFVCYSGNCGIHGDIYDAVGIVEGIQDKAEQYKHLEAIYGGTSEASPLAKVTISKEKTSFEPEPFAMADFEKYLSTHNDSGKIREYLHVRAYNSTHREFLDYPEDVENNLVQLFYYWPGIKTARNEGLTSETMKKAGIPQERKETGVSSWSPAGIVMKLGTGYKLHFYSEGICEKRGSKGCVTFPMPKGISKDVESIVLVEGEMDAAVCTAAGIENVFSTGGTNGLTKPKIEKFINNSRIKSVTILYDNDEPGKKASGLIKAASSDYYKQSLPERLVAAGYKGIIKIAQLQTYKDPDEAILKRHKDLVISAIESAVEWKDGKVVSEIPDKIEKSEKGQGKMTRKDIKALLKKLPFKNLAESEIQPVINSIINCAGEYEKNEVVADLIEWGAKKEQIKLRNNQDPYFLSDVAEAHDLSFYYVNKIRQATISKNTLQRFMTTSKTPLVRIKYELIDGTEELDTFIMKRGEKAAAVLCEHVLAGRFIYIQESKEFYFFNGLTWELCSAVTDVAYNILNNIIQHCFKNCQQDDSTRIKALSICRTQIEEYRYCMTVMNALKEKQSIFRKQVTFDGPLVQETLTLQDGVIDFSGKTIKYRNARPEEYRMAKLPYTIDQVRENKKPENFLKFMNSNFEDKDTLNTLMHFLSLIPSRRALFKVGGIFTGITNTGKTTTMNIISEIYSGMVKSLPRSVIMQKRYETDNGAPNPYLARLEGSGAAISDETKRNDVLDGAMWKQLTGGGMLTARGMYAQPRDFMPTAQIVILTNFSPKFDGKDQATIERMVIIPFRIQHKKDPKKTGEEVDIYSPIRPEYPLVVRLFAEYYIHLRHTLKDKIPLSKECEAYKQDYVQDQETDLDKFVQDNIDFIKDDKCFVPLKDLYQRFCLYNDIDLDEFGKPTDREAWTQSKFTRYLKNDYNEVHVKMVKINGQAVRVVLNTKLKDIQLTPAEVTEQLSEPKPITEPPAYHNKFNPDENPFE